LIIKKKIFVLVETSHQAAMIFSLNTFFSDLVVAPPEARAIAWLPVLERKQSSSINYKPRMN